MDDAYYIENNDVALTCTFYGGDGTVTWSKTGAQTIDQGINTKP